MNITTRNNLIQTTDNKIQARDRSFKPFTTYRNAVLPIANTQIASDVNTRLLYKWLIDNNLYDDLVLAVGGDYGIQKNYVDPNWQIENAYDLSKYSNNAGQATAANQPILFNKHFQNPSTELRRISFSNISFAQGSNHTVGFWMKPIFRAAFQMPIGKSNTNISTIYITDSSGNSRVFFRSESNQTKIITDAGAATPNFFDGKINQLVISVNGGANEVSTYFNGALVKLSTLDYHDIIYNSIFLGGVTTNIYEGLLDDVAILQTNLSQADVTSLYNLQKGKYGH